MIEVYPFTKMMWRSEEIRLKWEPMKKRIADATYFAEYESVKRGLRKADVYQLDPNRFDWQIKKVSLDGLHFLPILRSKQYGGYGHRHYTTETIDNDTFIYGVVGGDLESATRFHDAGVTDLKQRIKQWSPEEMNPHGIDHDVTGELLGYPECCRRFFNDVWLKDGCLDPMTEMALNTKEVDDDDGIIKVSGHPYLNRLIRYFGFNIIPFFPCSFHCEKALEFATWWVELMMEHDKEATDACLEMLSMPMVWSLNNCITYVEHPLFLGAANGYYTTDKKVVQWLP